MRILYVGYGSSIHTARWISLLSDLSWDIHLFPVDSYYLSSALRNVTVHLLTKNHAAHTDSSVKQSVEWPFTRGQNRLKAISSLMSADPLSAAARLARVIRRFKPDLLHSFELTGGILAYEAFQRTDASFPPWIHSSWGSDLLHFGRLSGYRSQALGLMKSCRYFMADCQRELDLAPEYGFQGEILGVFSASGGYDVAATQRYRQPGASSQRKVIALKGRHEDTLLGRAFYGLKAIELCKNELADYKIVVYLPQGEITGAVEYVKTLTGLDISIMPEHTSHNEILQLFGSSKIAIALGLIDGTPHSMMEAMMMGAWPIQSNSADTTGWIIDNQNGNTVPAEDPIYLSNTIKNLLKNDSLLDQAAELNLNLVARKKDISVVKPAIVDIYRRIVQSKQ